MTPDRAAALSLIVAVAIVGAVLVRRWPRLAVAAWLVMVFAVPVWIVVPGPGSLPVVAALGCLVAAGLARLCPTDRVALADLAMGALVVACVVGWLAAPGSLDAPVRVLTQWMAAYLIGRFAPAWVDVEWLYRVLAVLAGVAAVAGIIEYLTTTNPFLWLAVDNREYLQWGAPQSRAGQWRVEGAFGHSIAYGVSLALTLPIILRARLRSTVRGGILLATGVAVVLTFSRLAMLCAVLGVLLTIWQTPPRSLGPRVRAAAVATVVAVTGVVAVVLARTFGQAGDEASGSALYRFDLYELLPRIQPLGYADGRLRSADGTITVGGYLSVDNALLVVGLTYGWIPVLLVGALALSACVQVARRRATPAVVAMAAHLPVLFGVAFITQYTLYLWFLAGLAVATWTTRESDWPGRTESTTSRSPASTGVGA